MRSLREIIENGEIDLELKEAIERSNLLELSGDLVVTSLSQLENIISNT
jgi:hypothetical protein